MPGLGSKPPAQAIRLVLCESRPEDVEWLVSALRNGGVPSRPYAARSVEDLREHLKGTPADVLVWGDGFGPVSLEQACQVAEEFQVPVLIALDSLDGARFAAYKEAGAVDLYLRGHMDLARQTVVRWASLGEELRWAARARVEQDSASKSSEALLDAVGDPVAYLNEGLHVKANAPYLELLGLETFEDLEGMSLLDFVAKADVPVIRDKIKTLGRGQGASEDLEITLAAAGKVSMTLGPGHFEGEPCLLVSVRRPPAVALLPGAVSAGVASESAPPVNEDWLNKDAATGLYNRQYFLSSLQGRSSGSAWMIQADGQEQVVASLGATQLDAFIGALGAALAKDSPEGTVIARWTAGTLAVLCALDDDEQAQEWARQVQERVGQDLLAVGSRTLSITIGMAGVSLVEGIAVDDTIRSLEHLLKDTLAVPMGRRFADPRAEEKARARAMQERAQTVKEAISANRLVLLFQPVASMVEPCSRYEVLVRLNSAEGRLEEPAEFMPMAEAHGLAADIDAWVFREALRQAKERHEAGDRVELILKVSNASLKAGTAVETVAHELQRHAISPACVCLEVPASAVGAHAKEVRDLRDQATQVGMGVVLSGVGADPASLRLVDLVKPAWVKLSKDVTLGMSGNKDQQAALAAVLAHVHKQGIKVIAGFIQDASTMTVLFGSGIEALQGKFLGPPSPRMNFDFSQMGF